jgi:hypothetical protein
VARNTGGCRKRACHSDDSGGRDEGDVHDSWGTRRRGGAGGTAGQ